MDTLEQENEELKREVRMLKSQVHTLRMKMGALKVILTYDAPVCKEKLMECLLKNDGCVGECEEI